MRQLGYQIYYTSYQFSLCLGRIGPVLKHIKVPTYFDQACLEILPSKPAMMIQIFKKTV